MAAIARGKQRIMLKPNLVAPIPEATTKLPVMRALVRLMRSVHKDISIGEGSAAAAPFNVRNDQTFRTSNKDLLNGLQKHVFDALGYSEFSKTEKVPLVNLHTNRDRPALLGANDENPRSGRGHTGHEERHRSLPGRNLSGATQQHARYGVQGRALRYRRRIVDMVRANKLGLVVIDGSAAMEGNGPTAGTQVPMETIIAGENPLATDMVAASLIGFEPDEISTFTWVYKAGLRPHRLDEIKTRGEPLDHVRRDFVRPVLVPWNPAGTPLLR